MADPPKAPGAGPPVPPPQLSPLSGAYLLIVVGEPFSEEHKKLILQKLQQGLLTWSSGATLVDLAQELNTISDCSPPGEEARGGERLIQFATENLVTEVLIHPQVNTLQQCMKNMLASFTKHRHIIHAGYTFAGKGSWILQDGTYSFADFTAAFEEYDVQRVIRSYENSISVHVHCCQEGDWKQDKVDEQPFAKLCQVELNPDSQISESEAVSTFVTYMEPFLQPQSIQERLPPSDVVGNIRFSHPTLYVFPGGQGDSALFGINGFNMLIDGGFSRKACFWDFTRHLDRLDAILVTRLSDENTQGISQVLERKSAEPVYPQIGHFFANILDTGASNKEKYDEEEKDKLLVNVIHEGNSMIENLRILNLKPQICFRDNICDPINLYHKVGHGKLDMYVLNPSKESREVKEFLARWSEDTGQLGSMKSGINVDGKELWLPIANLVSICALLIWQPANPNDTITRLLFPGSTPQNKIFKGLEKLRKLECLKHATCSSSSLKEAKTGRHSKEKRRTHKTEAKASQPDNSVLERKEKLARRKQEKAKKEKEERERQEREKREEKEKRDRQKEENENFEKEKRERLEKLERKKKADKEKRDKEKQEQSEKDALAKKEKEEKQAAAKKEKEEKDAATKKERDEKEALTKKERDEKRKEREEKQKQAVKKDKEIPTDVVKDEDKLKKKIPAPKSKPKDTPKLKKAEVKQDSNDSIKTRKVMPSKPLVKSSTPPPSKLKKDESNKKVMETRKAAAAKIHKKQPDNEEKSRLNKSNRVVSATKKQSKKTSPPDDKPVDEKSVVERVSQAIASGAIDDSRVIKDDEDDRESIVEKDQIEEMETSPDNHQDKDFVKALDDDEEVELQRIKDEEDDDNQQREPDIGENELKKEPPLSPPKDLVIDQSTPKVAYSHVKTPDEVDDLPEHEVVNPDESMLEEIKSEMSYDLEEKIAKDESEKENNLAKKDKSEGSVEALRGNEEVEVPIEQKSVPAVKGEDRSESKHSEEVKEVAGIEYETSIHIPKIEQSENVGEINNVSDETPKKNQEATSEEPEKEKDEAEESVLKASLQDANDKENEQGKVEVQDAFLSNISTAKGRHEHTCKDPEEEDSERLDAGARCQDVEVKESDKDNVEQSNETPKAEPSAISAKKESEKASQGTENEDIDQNPEDDETAPNVKSDDAFINNISEAEGRQEAVVEEVEDIGDIKEVEDDETTSMNNAEAEEKQQNKDEAQDGFLNNISTAEGRQETACKGAEEEEEEKHEDGVQLPVVEEKASDKDNVEESDKTPKEEQVAISIEKASVNTSEDNEVEDIDQNEEEDEICLNIQSDIVYVTEISDTEGRQEFVAEEVGDIANIKEDEDDKTAALSDAKNEEKEQDKKEEAVVEEVEDIGDIKEVEGDETTSLNNAKAEEKQQNKDEAQNEFLNNISTAEGKQETACNGAEERDKEGLDDGAQSQPVDVILSDNNNVDKSDKASKEEQVAISDKKESVKASEDTKCEDIDQNVEEDKNAPNVKSDDAFVNEIAETEGRQEAVAEEVEDVGDIQEVEDDNNVSLPGAKNEEKEESKEEAQDEFLNNISTAEGRQETANNGSEDRDNKGLDDGAQYQAVEVTVSDNDNVEESDNTPMNEQVAISDKKDSVKASEDTEDKDNNQNEQEDENVSNVKSDDAFVNEISETEGRQEAVAEDVGDIQAVEDDKNGSLPSAKNEEKEEGKEEAQEEFLNNISTAEGRQEIACKGAEESDNGAQCQAIEEIVSDNDNVEESKNKPMEKQATISDQKESVKASEDNKGEDIDQNEEENENVPDVKSDDAFVNEISETEGRQEAVAEVVVDIQAVEDDKNDSLPNAKNEEKEEGKEELQEEFLNNISTAEGRQEIACKGAEEREDGVQCQASEEIVPDNDNVEESEKTPTKKQAAISDKKESVKASEDNEGEDIDQNEEEDENVPKAKSDDAFVNEISETEGRQEVVAEEVEDVGDIQEVEDDKIASLHEDKNEEKEECTEDTQDEFLNNISTAEGRQETACKDAEERDNKGLDDGAQCQAVEELVSDNGNVEQSDETSKDEQTELSDIKESVKASQDTEDKEIDQNAEKEETCQIARSDHAFVNEISEAERRQEAVIKDVEDIEEVETYQSPSLHDTKNEEKEQGKEEGQDAFLNNISTVEGRQETASNGAEEEDREGFDDSAQCHNVSDKDNIEESEETPKIEPATVSDEKDPVKVSQNTEDMDIDQIAEEDETGQSFKVDDAFVNEISEAEGRQEAVIEDMEKFGDVQVVEDEKNASLQDAFLNTISTSEERQEVSDKDEAGVSEVETGVKEREDTLDYQKEEIQADEAFTNEIAESEERQEAVIEEVEKIGGIEDVTDDKEVSSKDSILNKSSEADTSKKTKTDDDIPIHQDSKETRIETFKTEETLQTTVDGEDKNTGDTKKEEDEIIDSSLQEKSDQGQDQVISEYITSASSVAVAVATVAAIVSDKEDEYEENKTSSLQPDQSEEHAECKDKQQEIKTDIVPASNAKSESDILSSTEGETQLDNSYIPSPTKETEHILENKINTEDSFINEIAKNENRQEEESVETEDIKAEKGKDTVEEEKAEVKAGDAILNIISTSEGRQDQTNTLEKEEDPCQEDQTDKGISNISSTAGRQQEISQGKEDEEKEDHIDEGALLNVISTSEGRQDATDSGEVKEEQNEKSQHDITVEDAFVNNISEAEGRQEESLECAEKGENVGDEIEDKKKADNAITSASENQRETTTESPDISENTMQHQDEQVKVQTDDAFTNKISITEGRQESDDDVSETTNEHLATSTDTSALSRTLPTNQDDSCFNKSCEDNAKIQEAHMEDATTDETDDKPGLIWADEVEKESKLKAEEYEMNMAKAEKVVEEIVIKAEKVMGQVQEKLNENDAKKDSTESLTEFSKISQESKEVVQKLEESYILEKGSLENTDKKESTNSVSFHHIEQESKEIVSKLEESFHEDISSSTRVTVCQVDGEKIPEKECISTTTDADTVKENYSSKEENQTQENIEDVKDIKYVSLIMDDEKEPSLIKEIKEDTKGIKDEKKDAVSLKDTNEDRSSSNVNDVNTTNTSKGEEEKANSIKVDREPIISLKGEKEETSSTQDKQDDISFTKDEKLKTSSIKDEQVETISLIEGKDDSILTKPENTDSNSLIGDKKEISFNVAGEEGVSSISFENYEASAIKDTSTVPESRTITEVKEDASLITKDKEEARNHGDTEDASSIKDRKDGIITGMEEEEKASSLKDEVELVITLKDDKKETSSIHDEKDNISFTENEKLETGSIMDGQVETISLPDSKDDSSLTNPNKTDSISLIGDEEEKIFTVDDKQGASSNTSENYETSDIKDTSLIPKARTINEGKEDASFEPKDMEEVSSVQDDKEDVSSINDKQDDIITGMGEEEKASSLKDDIEPAISLKDDKEETSLTKSGNTDSSSLNGDKEEKSLEKDEIISNMNGMGHSISIKDIKDEACSAQDGKKEASKTDVDNVEASSIQDDIEDESTEKEEASSTGDHRETVSSIMSEKDKAMAINKGPSSNVEVDGCSKKDDERDVCSSNGRKDEASLINVDVSCINEKDLKAGDIQDNTVDTICTNNDKDEQSSINPDRKGATSVHDEEIEGSSVKDNKEDVSSNRDAKDEACSETVEKEDDSSKKDGQDDTGATKEEDQEEDKKVESSSIKECQDKCNTIKDVEDVAISNKVASPTRDEKVESTSVVYGKDDASPIKDVEEVSKSTIYDTTRSTQDERGSIKDDQENASFIKSEDDELSLIKDDKEEASFITEEVDEPGSTLGDKEESKSNNDENADSEKEAASMKGDKQDVSPLKEDENNDKKDKISLFEDVEESSSNKDNQENVSFVKDVNEDASSLKDEKENFNSTKDVTKNISSYGKDEAISMKDETEDAKSNQDDNENVSSLKVKANNEDDSVLNNDQVKTSYTNDIEKDMDQKGENNTEEKDSKLIKDIQEICEVSEVSQEENKQTSTGFEGSSDISSKSQNLKTNNVDFSSDINTKCAEGECTVSSKGVVTSLPDTISHTLSPIKDGDDSSDTSEKKVDECSSSDQTENVCSISEKVKSEVCSSSEKKEEQDSMKTGKEEQDSSSQAHKELNDTSSTNDVIIDSSINNDTHEDMGDNTDSCSSQDLVVVSKDFDANDCKSNDNSEAQPKNVGLTEDTKMSYTISSDCEVSKPKSQLETSDDKDDINQAIQTLDHKESEHKVETSVKKEDIATHDLKREEKSYTDEKLQTYVIPTVSLNSSEEKDLTDNIQKSNCEATGSVTENTTEKDKKEKEVDESSATAIQSSLDKCTAKDKSYETIAAENSETQCAEPNEMVKHGVLQVKVIGAADLVNRDMIGKSDPYIVVSLNDKKSRSQTVSNSLEPQWNFCSNFDVSDGDEHIIQFNVFDDDFGKDQAQGSCSMTVKEAICEKNTSWLTLQGCKSGKISVSFEFKESEANDEDDESVSDEVNEDNIEVTLEAAKQTEKNEGSTAKEDITSLEQTGKVSEKTKAVSDIKEDDQDEASDNLVLAEEDKEDLSENDRNPHQQPEEVSVKELEITELIIDATDGPTSNDDSSQIQKSSNEADTDDIERLKSTFAEHHGKSFDGESTSNFSTELSERRASADEAQITKPLSSSEPKGFMANLKGTIGGFFFKQEETIVEDDDVKGEARVPREFMMQTETYSTEGACLTTKQPENLKDIPIMEEIEPVENENENTYPQLSLTPIESLSQSENSCHDESDKQKAASNEERKVKSLNLQKEVDEIEFIISNVFAVLGELSESVGCSKNIQAMRVDLDSIKLSTSGLDAGETELVSVMSSLQGVVLRAKQQGADVEPNPVPKATFDRLLEACQQICNTANGKSLENNSTTTCERTSSLGDNNKQEDQKHDKQLEGAGAEEQQTSTDEILEEETDSNNAVLSKEKTEGIGKLKATVIEETVSPETVSNDPAPSACQDEGKEDGAEESADSQDADRLHSNPQPNLDSHSEVLSHPADSVQYENNANNDGDDDGEEEEEEEASSDYKVIPETSTGAEKAASLMATDSGTEDQISSGTFSHEDLSPRFADLPQQLGSRAEQVLAEDLKLTRKDRTLSMETRTTSITSDASEQEIPPSSPRSALTLSPTTESSTSTTAKFMYGETIEKSVTDSVDIMTQSIYIGSEDCDSEMSSESHQSVVSQTTQRKVSSSEESNVKTTVKSEYVVSEAIVKVSENVAETILEETKSITKKAEVVSKEEIKVDCEKSKETTVEKFVETRQEAKLSYSEVVRADTSKSIKATEEKSVAKEAVAEVLKTDTVLQLVDSKDEPAGSSSNGKKMSYSEVLRSDKLKDDPIADWGKPLGLPSPNRPSTPAKQAKKKEEEVPVDTNKTPDSVEPVWLDLAYVPHHGSSNYANAEFFKRVRARYYVFSGVEPSREVFNALLEAKKTWENKEQEVTIIPTYDTDVLGYWVAENEELLTELKIDLAPSASRCTINLQDHATSCAAYRLEF